MVKIWDFCNLEKVVEFFVLFVENFELSKEREELDSNCEIFDIGGKEEKK